MSDEKLFGLDEDDYKNHLNEVKDWPEFTITNDRISGRIPVVKIDSWSDIPSLLEYPFFKRNEGNYIFRGQRKYNWSLTPTLARVTNDGVVRKEVAQKLLDTFRLSIRGRIEDYSLIEESETDELWAVGQHHGLNTPLIDWTHSPYVALFFAFNEADDKVDLNTDFDEKENKYRCIYVLDKRFIETEDEMDSVRVYEPKKDGHGRLVNQAGLFTISDYETSIESEILEYVSQQSSFESLSEEEQAEEVAQYICKIYIPNTDREGCLKFLRKMNVHHASLFPDLIGASEYSNLMIEEYVSSLEEEGVEEVQETEEAGETGTDRSDKQVKAGQGGKEADDDYEEKAIEESLELVEALTGILNDDEKQDISKEVVKEIRDEILENLVTDWYKRDSVKAQIRNKVRSVLRSNNLYISPGDQRINSIIDLLESRDELKE